MSHFVISEGTAIRLSSIIAVNTDKQNKHIVYLDNGVWLDVTEKLFRVIITAMKAS